MICQLFKPVHKDLTIGELEDLDSVAKILVALGNRIDDTGQAVIQQPQLVLLVKYIDWLTQELNTRTNIRSGKLDELQKQVITQFETIHQLEIALGKARAKNAILVKQLEEKPTMVEKLVEIPPAPDSNEFMYRPIPFGTAQAIQALYRLYDMDQEFGKMIDQNYPVLPFSQCVLLAKYFDQIDSQMRNRTQKVESTNLAN